MQFELPIGQRYARQLAMADPSMVKREAERAGHGTIFDAVQAVSDADLVPAYLHSALCAMSLPARRPRDEMAPIIRQDGRYTLAITPKPVLRREGGEMILTSLGVPFGSYPRVILIYIMSEAVRTGSREIYLGASFKDWLRRLGYENATHGVRGTASLLRGQLDRLLACEWMIRWDDSASDDAAFAVKEVKLANEYAGLRSKDGSFIREISLADGFFSHLRDHAVPLNEAAIRQLKNNPTALDLYTYFAYRLQRVGGDKPAMLSWDQLAVHLGNAAESPRKFRQTIRQSWDLVSGVYPNARVDLSGPIIKMWSSPPPVEKRLIGAHLHLVKASSADAGATPTATLAAPRIAPVMSEPTKTTFPNGSLRFGDDEKLFLEIARSHGGGYDIDMIADAYRQQVGASLARLTGPRLEKSFEAFCVSYAERRGAL
jgi:hypothetical protein